MEEIYIFIKEEIKTFPIIDFIETIPVDMFILGGKIQFIQY